MQKTSIWATMLGVEKTIVRDLDFDEDSGVLLATVSPHKSTRNRCGICRRHCSRYDRGEGPRRWRTLDLGTVETHLVAEAPRVRCPEHGVTVAAVPWARHQAGHTRIFDQQISWLATQTSKSAVTKLMRIAWRTVGSIIDRVWKDTAATFDPFANLKRIGIDEISYKRGHKYLTVVVDHDSGRLIWASPGRDKATLGKFFDALGERRSAQITHVSADAAEWIATVVTNRCPNAVRVADPFHVVQWATGALDAERRTAWNRARKAAKENERPRGKGRPAKDARHGPTATGPRS